MSHLQDILEQDVDDDLPHQSWGFSSHLPSIDSASGTLEPSDLATTHVEKGIDAQASLAACMIAEVKAVLKRYVSFTL